MSDEVSVRELRNHTAAVLRRVEAAEQLPAEAAISVVTLAELELGVHLASSEDIRAARLQTLRSAESTYVPLPIDGRVTTAFAALVASARRAGRRPKVQDSWIAATARAHDVAVYTQDSDFDHLAVEVVRI